MRNAFLQLIGLGAGQSLMSFTGVKDWGKLKVMADKQGLSAVVLDGIEKLPVELRPKQEFLLQWIGEVIQGESVFMKQKKAAEEMALLFHDNYIKTFVFCNK